MGKGRLVFSILVMALNTVGILGAILFVLDIPLGAVLSAGLLTGGLTLFGFFSLFFWNTGDGRTLMLRAAVFCAIYGAIVILCGNRLAEGLSCALQNAIEIFNASYADCFVWNIGAALMREAEEDVFSAVRDITVSLLLVLLPFEVLIGFCVVHGRWFLLLLENAVWVAGACIFYRFPPYPLVVCAVLGFLTVLVAGEFSGEAVAGSIAACLTALTGGLVMAFLYLFFVPKLDAKYDDIKETRLQLYQIVNEGLVPELNRLLAPIGKGGGPQITGRLNRGDGFSRTSEEFYCITVSERPKQTVYLKGFVGNEYEGEAWGTEAENALSAYYKAHDIPLSDTYGEIASLTYEVLRADSAAQGEEKRLWVEELAGAGNYSLYPYGALLTEGYTVHADGSAERLGQGYSFTYYNLADYSGNGSIPGVWRDLEESYRSYVYDSFLDYPEERLPELTDFLEEWNPGEDSVSGRVAAVMELLDAQAEYNLNVGKTPGGKDFAEYFLLESKEGYCAHFATAGVLILRYLGIPARYVAGYCAVPEDFRKNKDGTWSAALTGRQAHAWPEIYLDGLGWVPVEMTPAAGSSVWDGYAQLELVEQLAGEEDVWRKEQGGGDEWSARTKESAQTPPDEVEFDIEVGQKEITDEEQTGSKQASKTKNNGGGNENEAQEKEQQEKEQLSAAAEICLTVAALLAALAAILIQRQVRLKRREARRSRADRDAQVRLLYGEFRGALALAGLKRGVAVDSERFWEGLSALCPGVKDETVKDWLLVLEKCSFSEKQPTEAEVRKIAALTRPVMARIYKGLPFYKKMVYLYMRCYEV